MPAVFLVDEPADAARRARLEEGAVHLGAAFQKINFLRDLAVDWHQLGRNYFPWVDPDAFTEADKARILDDIDHDLELAGRDDPRAPAARAGARWPRRTACSPSSRHDCRQTPAERLIATRIRVPDGEKLAIAVRSAISAGGLGR